MDDVNDTNLLIHGGSPIPWPRYRRVTDRRRVGWRGVIEESEEDLVIAVSVSSLWSAVLCNLLHLTICYSSCSVESFWPPPKPEGLDGAGSLLHTVTMKGLSNFVTAIPSIRFLWFWFYMSYYFPLNMFFSYSLNLTKDIRLHTFFRVRWVSSPLPFNPWKMHVYIMR